MPGLAISKRGAEGDASWPALWAGADDLLDRVHVWLKQANDLTIWLTDIFPLNFCAPPLNMY